MKTKVGVHRCFARTCIGIRRNKDKKRKNIILSHKNWKLDKLLSLIREEALKIQNYNSELRISADAIALQFNAKKSLVTKCFYILSNEGIIGHKIRDIIDMDGCWFHSHYSIIPKK